MSEKINNWLKGKGYRKSTIRSYGDTIKNYLDWLEEVKINPRESNYNDLLDYISKRRSEGDKKRTLKSRLTAIGHYYDYLRINDNPVRKIRLKGSDKSSNGHPLKEEELRNIFEKYEGRKSDKIIIGLLIFQGLKPKEITNLRNENIRLNEGKITIEATHRSNGRILKLEAEQIIGLHENKHIFQRLNNNDFARITRHIKKNHRKIKGLRHIRASVISSWMERHDMRIVQYMAGHKYLGSTQHYGRDGLEGLQKMISELHPLKNTSF
jgi:site-specific recombinase XerD